MIKLPQLKFINNYSAIVNIRKLTYLLLFSMLFWPLLSYITFGFLRLRSIAFYYTAITIVYGIFYVITLNKITLPKELKYLLFYILFLFIWTFFNGAYERRGLLAILLDNPNIAIYFIVIIIYNTKFNDNFFRKSIFILKITIILAAIVSFVQVFNSAFLNAGILYKYSDRFFQSGIYQIRRLSIFGYIDLNSVGLTFMPIVSIVSGYLLFLKKRKYIIFLFLGSITAFLSNTRYVMISFIIITLQVLVYRRVSFKGLARYATLVVFLLISVYAGLKYIGYNLELWYETRLFAEGSLEQTTRFKAIGNFLLFFPKYYLFGIGEVYADKIVQASKAVGSSHIHIGYLSHLVAYGIVGSFFLFKFWYLLAKKLYSTAKLTNYWGSFFAFLTFLWAFATFSNTSIFFYGLIFALVFDKYITDNYSNRTTTAVINNRAVKTI